MNVHVRWPARPAELRAGLDFFGSFCIKAKRTSRFFEASKRKKITLLKTGIIFAPQHY
jgi:hypothetical protein